MTDLQPLGIEADEAAAIRLEGGHILVTPLVPRKFDGCDVRVRGMSRPQVTVRLRKSPRARPRRFRRRGANCRANNFARRSMSSAATVGQSGSRRSAARVDRREHLSSLRAGENGVEVYSRFPGPGRESPDRVEARCGERVRTRLRGRRACHMTRRAGSHVELAPRPRRKAPIG